MTSPAEPRRALVVGTGLIGGSIGMALRARGWTVTGRDIDETRAAEALALGVVDRIGDDPHAEIAIVATPAGAVREIAADLLGDPARRDDLVVTDVSGVKQTVIKDVPHPRFVGGHPMAGSEQSGVAGADADLFVGAAWVLTPTTTTDLDAFSRLRTVVTSLGAEVIELSPGDHDRLVAVISHVPHLVAATLMNIAADGGTEEDAALRLAAGGFRDMTRIAAGDPDIWPDICTENANAIAAGLDRVVEALGDLRRRIVATGGTAVFDPLSRASIARRRLSKATARPDRLAEIRVPVPDREGVLAEITTLASGIGMNIYDIEIAHSTEGERGVLILVVDAARAEQMRHAVVLLGYRATVQVLP